VRLKCLGCLDRIRQVSDQAFMMTVVLDDRFQIHRSERLHELGFDDEQDLQFSAPFFLLLYYTILMYGVSG